MSARHCGQYRSPNINPPNFIQIIRGSASVEKMIKKLELFMTASGEFLGEINAIGGTEVAASFWVTSQNSKLMNLSLVWGTQKP